ncbi:hypothetical protein DW837_05090 [Phocaeicola vulgatus]|nr:hypothetical protein DW837_05090 [Phocaeicola vulgatus]
MFVFILSCFSIFIYRLSICKCISYFDTTKEKRKKLSKNDKNISFFVLYRMEVYEETDFMQEVTGIGELILPIAFAFTGRGDFVCPNYIE